MFIKYKPDAKSKDRAEIMIYEEPINYTMRLRAYEEIKRCCKIAGFALEDCGHIEKITKKLRNEISENKTTPGRVIFHSSNLFYVCFDFNLIQKYAFLLKEIIAHEIAHVWDRWDYCANLDKIGCLQLIGMSEYKPHSKQWEKKMKELGHPARKRIKVIKNKYGKIEN